MFLNRHNKKVAFMIIIQIKNWAQAIVLKTIKAHKIELMIHYINSNINYITYHKILTSIINIHSSTFISMIKIYRMTIVTDIEEQV